MKKKFLMTCLAVFAAILVSRLVAVSGLYTPFLLHNFLALYSNPVSGSPNPVSVLQVRPGFTGRWLSGETLLRLPCPAVDGSNLVLRAVSPENDQAVEAIVNGVDHYRFTLHNDAPTDLRIPVPAGPRQACAAEVRLVSKTSRLPGDDRDLSLFIDTLAYDPCPMDEVHASNGALFATGQTWPVYRDVLPDLLRQLVHGVLYGWDAAWYVDVAQNGYSFKLETPQRQYNVNFFPLYPLLGVLAQKALGLEMDLTLLIVANILFLAALVGLYYYVAARFDHDAALTAVTLLCFYPGAFFFSIPYSESLMLLLTVVFLILADRNRWWAAAGCAALASAARMIGVSFSLVFVYRFIREKAWRSRDQGLRLAGQALLSISGFALYSAYQWYAFGTPFAASYATKNAWKVPTEDWLSAMLTAKPLLTLIHELSRNPFSFFHLSSTNILLFLAAVLVCGLLAKKLGAAATIVAFSQLFLIYMSFAGMNLFSTTRYIAVIVPFFAGLGLLFSRQLKWFYPALLAYFTVSLYLLSFFWIAGILS